MESKSLFLSCDWGTTAFRLKLVDLGTGKSISSARSSVGIKSIEKRWQNEGTSENRISFFLRYLRKEIENMTEGMEGSPEEIPVVISGMASSGIGILELPYARLPLSLKNPGLNTEFIPASGSFPHDLILVSGICSEQDVMRGEEIQLVGLAATHPVSDCICILPGTHSKHVFVNDDKVVDFRTYITGELFELLSTNSILAGSVEDSAGDLNLEAFGRGLRDSLEGRLLHSLFGIRARDLLENSDHKENYDYLSGLLIGSELKMLRNSKQEKMFLAGSEKLQTLYGAALKWAGLPPAAVADTENLTVMGQRVILFSHNN